MKNLQNNRNPFECGDLPSGLSLFRGRRRKGFVLNGVFMKTLSLVLLLFIISCQDSPIEPVKPIPFDLSGTWANISVNSLNINLFLLQKNEYEFTGDVYGPNSYLGSIENGKIIGEERYVSFTYTQPTPWGEALMGFNGRFYKVDDIWELRGKLGGSTEVTNGLLAYFRQENYKFVKKEFEYLFKK